MPRRLVVLLTVLLLASAASAQNWFGVRSGYPLGVTAHYGAGDALANGADLRVSARVVVGPSGSAAFGVGVDALVDVFADGPISAYVGGGPSLEAGGGHVDLDVHGLIGGAFRFTDVGLAPLSVFLEANLGAAISLSGGTARIPTFGAAVGFNWDF
ncbi:MAG: hypothetical protein ABR510_04955 [Trueperaceae bacterium]